MYKLANTVGSIWSNFSPHPSRLGRCVLTLRFTQLVCTSSFHSEFLPLNLQLCPEALACRAVAIVGAQWLCACKGRSLEYIAKVPSARAFVFAAASGFANSLLAVPWICRRKLLAFKSTNCLNVIFCSLSVRVNSGFFAMFLPASARVIPAEPARMTICIKSGTNLSVAVRR